MSEEAKPAQMGISVKQPNGEVIHFKIKKDTPFSKVFNAVANAMGVAVNTIRFSFDGETLKEHDTAKMKEMEEGDQIDAHIEQLGGAAGAI